MNKIEHAFNHVNQINAYISMPIQIALVTYINIYNRE